MAGPVEAPNTLVSNTRIKIVDVMTEGTFAGFAPASGISGYNPLCSVYFDGVPIINGDGSPNWNISGQGFKFSYVSGTSGQQPMVGFEKVEALIPLPANTRVANPPPSNGYIKNVVATFNTSMYPDAEALKVTIRFPAVYTVDTVNGNTNGFDISWAVDVSLNNGPYVNVGEHSLSDFASSPKCTSPYLNTQIYTLPKTTPAQDYYDWRVQVRRVSQNVMSNNTANDMFVDSMAVVSSNTYRYPMTALAGLEVSADQFGGIPTRAYDIRGVKVLVPQGYTPTQYDQISFARQCDVTISNRHIAMTTQALAQLANIELGTQVVGAGIPAGATVVAVNTAGPYFFTIDVDPTATTSNTTVSFVTPRPGSITEATYPAVWDGTFGERQWTDNPAWIFYDLVTNKRYGLGNYVRSEWVDKWSLYQIAQYCDEFVDDSYGDGGEEPRFTCNVALLDPQDAYTLLNNLVSVFQGMIYWSNGRLFPVGGEIRSPVFNFTNANVLGGGFSYTSTPRNTRSTVCVVKWNDPANQFRSTPERVGDPTTIARFGWIEKDLTAFATTSRGQALRAANWLLTVEQQLTETVNFQTDLEGLYLRPGDVFNVYDNYRNNQQQGGRLLDFSADRTYLHLDRPTILEPSFTYFLSAIVPAPTYLGSGQITGSNDISLIRNSQIETRLVTTAATAPNTVQYLTVSSGFSSPLYEGSPWILTASGTGISVFDEATQYKCVSIAEGQPGVFDILGVEYQTGINITINTTYGPVSPPVAGDTTPPAAPTGLGVNRITGLLNNNQFFDYLYLNWTGSASANTTYYTVSGRIGGGVPFIINQTTTTGQNYNPTVTGVFTFGVAANNANGYQSAFNTISYVRSGINPLGTTAALSGVYIANNFDVYYVRPTDGRYTGYIGTQPTFGWHIPLDANDNETPTAQFITGYRVRLLELGNESNVLSLSDISLTGQAQNNFTFDPRYLYTGASVKPLRGFTFSVDTVDKFGNVASGARLAVNNPQLPRPINSGFVGYNGGISYNITPAAQLDTSGVYIWVDQSPTFTPTFANVDFASTNFAGNASVAPQTGSFYTWFALADTFGFSGSNATAGDSNAPIYGPISGNADAMFGTFFVDISDRLTGAFNYLTGAITTLQSEIYNTGSTLLTYVYGLSGSITGEGAISTALNVTLNTAVVSASGANSTQINAVSARLVTTGANNYALAGTIMDALATTGGANSAYLTQLSAVTTGQFATTKVMADAFVTGYTPNGTGGAALARWGFELNANGKVVSMKATASSFPTSYGEIVFGSADLLSDNFSAGTAGWRIKANGDVEFNDGLFRGDLAIQSGTDQQVFAGTLPDSYGNGLLIGKLSSSIGGGLLATDTNTLTPFNISLYRSSNQVGFYGIGASQGGELILRDSSANIKVDIRGSDGSITGRSLQAGPHFYAHSSAVDITGVNFRIYDASANQRFRVDNTNGYIYVQNTQVVRNQYSTPLVLLSDVINCLTYHGLGV